MNRRSTPKADAQRAIVQALHIALPRDAIVHHAVNEIAAYDRRGQIRLWQILGVINGQTTSYGASPARR